MVIRGSVKHGTQLAVIVLTLCVLGILAATRIPVQMIPDLEIRTITVRTIWAGATPQDVEKEILIEQEEYLRNVPNLQRMIATASFGSAQIELEFPFGVDIGDAMVRVNNALSQVPSYPENVDEPRLYASSFSQNAFLFFRLDPLPGRAVRLDMDMMRDFIDDNVRTRMERVQGVSEVWNGSGAQRQIRIEVDPARLAATGLGLTELRDAIRARNRDVTAGDVDSGNKRYLIRTVGRFESADDLEDMIIAHQGGASVRLRDVGTVELDHFELTRKTFINGEPTFLLAVRREIGSNVIDTREAMMDEVAAINADVLEPVGLEMVLTSDDVRYVRASIENVWTNLAIGAVLATMVMFLFLRSVPATLVAVVGIPICTLAAFIGLLAAGRTINVISLAGVAFAIGMTLDNGIVVLEAIERARRRGLDRFKAALEGVKRVWPAVLAATMTTILVFAPVLFVREEAGQLFSDIAIAISAAIIASMLVAITVVPSASARVRLVRADDQSGGAAHSPSVRRIVSGVRWLVATWPRRLVGFGAPLAGTLAIIVLLTPPSEYLPEGEEAKTFSLMIAPPGYNYPTMARIAEEVQEVVIPHLQSDGTAFEAGETPFPPIDWFLMSVNSERLFVVSETVDPKQIEALMSALDNLFRSYPGMRGFSSRGSIISSNDGGTRAVNLDVSGVDLRAIYETADAARRRAEEVFENPQINSDPSSLSLDQPLIEFVPRWDRVAELGMTARDVGFALSALSDGAYVDEALIEGDRIDIFMFSNAGSAQTLGNLASLPLSTPGGAIVPAGAIADMVERVDTDTVRRIDGRRTVTLNIIPPRSVALETAVGMVEQDVIGYLRANGEIGQGVSIGLSGASGQMDATRAALSGNFVVAVILCYLVLVAIFSHWGFPLVIMTTVPLGIAGGIVGLWLLNTLGGMLPAVGIAAISQPFDMITMLGFLILLGTVVNNPILIVDQTLRYIREDGMTPRAAVPEAVATRLRPMMMATITTVFGIAPLVFLPGAGTELYRGVGAIVLFGLLFAAVITVIFLPPLLVMVLDIARIVRGRRETGEEPEAIEDEPESDKIRRIG